jgi:class 3 adenylate cyclase
MAAGLFALASPNWDSYYTWDSPLEGIEYLAGVALLIAGLVAATRRSGRPISRLMLLGSAVYFIPYVASLRNDAAFTIASLTLTWWLPVGAHIALAFPDGRLQSLFDRVVVVGGYVTTVVLTVVQMTVYDPQRLGQCPPDTNCLRNLLLVSHNPGLLELFELTSTWISLVVGVAVLGRLVVRMYLATPPERRVLAPVFVALAIAAATFVGAMLASLLAPANLGLQEAMYFAISGSVMLLPLGLLVGILRAILARSSAGNLLYRIGEGRTPAEIERDVAWALGDPSARLAFRAGRDTSFLDSSGRIVDPRESRRTAVSIVDDADGAAVALLHDPAVRRDQPELLETVLGAARLAIDNSRLRTEVQLVHDVPAGLAERLLREGARIGESKTLTISVLMSDVRGYTTLAEHGNAHALAAQLNEHRGTMNRIITERGGTVMQFVGDAVFAVFGAPDPLAAHAVRAVDAAIAMQHAQASINEGWAVSGIPAFELGIGVTTGPVAAALLGSREHVEYSVVGDVVNLAQRIQSMASGGEVMVTDVTFSALGGAVPAEEMPPVVVKGRKATVTAHRIRPESINPRPIGSRSARSMAAEVRSSGVVYATARDTTDT